MLDYLLNLSGKRIIVTGGGSGIGAETCRLFAALGAHVMIADLKIEAADAVAERLNGGTFRGRGVAQRLDVTDPASCKSCVEAAGRELGGVDVLFNCAGIVVPDGPDGATVDAFRRMWEVNTLGTFQMMDAVTPGMVAQGRGSIINMGSVAGEEAIYRRTAYCSSKGGVHLLTLGEAIRLAAHGVRVNAIAPGRVFTEMVKGYLMKSSDPATDFRRSCSTQASGVMALPHHIAKIAAFLASDMSEVMIGAVLDASNGWLAGYQGDMANMPPAFEPFREAVRNATGLDV